MKSQDILKEMRGSIGTKQPIDFFSKLVDLFEIMFTRLDHIEKVMDQVKVHSALAISWEPRVASNLLSKQVVILRENKDVYTTEIASFQKALVENKITQSYKEFVQFWMDTLGYHPFLD